MNIGRLFNDKLSTRLQACNQEQFNKGRLDIKAPQGQQWSLYFDLGHLIGDAGGLHPARRWCRQLSHYCPQLGVDPASILEGNGLPYWDYDSLAKLVRQEAILRQQMVEVVKGSVTEVLFDILQQEQILSRRSESQLTYTYVPEVTLYSSPLVYIPIDQAWMQAQQAWEHWRRAGLEDIFPNMAPVIRQQQELQQQTSASVYRSLTALVNGKWTIRDLALKLRQDPLVLTQSLTPYVRKGLIQLIQVADLGNSVEGSTVIQPNQAPTPTPSSTTSKPAEPLVAYIDDSRIDSRVMGQILTKAGYRYINIQDSVQALPFLLEQKPNLIFLDLVMPIANGYEICAQIRRTSIFKDTPVVIVTGNDGIVDRVRAKIVRSTDFLAKPIDTSKVLAILRKYLPAGNLRTIN